MSSWSPTELPSIQLGSSNGFIKTQAEKLKSRDPVRSSETSWDTARKASSGAAGNRR